MFNFWITPILREGGQGWYWYCWVLGREVVSFHRLSIQTPLYLVLFGHNLRCKFCLGVAKLQFWRRGGRRESEIGPTSSPGMTSYRLPIVTLTIFTVLSAALGVRDGQADGIGLAIDGTMH